MQAKVSAYMKFGVSDSECSNGNLSKGKYQILPTDDGAFPIDLGNYEILINLHFYLITLCRS